MYFPNSNAMFSKMTQLGRLTDEPFFNQLFTLDTFKLDGRLNFEALLVGLIPDTESIYQDAVDYRRWLPMTLSLWDPRSFSSSVESWSVRVGEMMRVAML